MFDALVQLLPLSVEYSQLYELPPDPDSTNVPLLFIPQCALLLTSPPTGVEDAETVTIYSSLFVVVPQDVLLTTALK